MKSQTGVQTRQYIHQVNSVVSTMNTQAWSKQGGLHGVGAPSFGPWSYWTWIGYGRVKVRTSWVQRKEHRVALGKSKRKDAKDRGWLFLSEVDSFLLGEGREIQGKEVNFHVSKLSVNVQTYSPRKMVLEDKESTYSQETIFASISDRICSENADFVSGLTAGNILGTNKSCWERKGTEMVGKMVLKGWTSECVPSQQMSDSHVLLLSKASVRVFGGSDHGRTNTDIPKHCTWHPSHQHKPAPVSGGNGNAYVQGCGLPCVLPSL